jgi:transcriptional regulator with XRE-family HTH domain
MEITLKAARINAGLTQEQVKAKTGYSRNSLYRWEKGIGSPKWKDLKRLCELYGVPAECIKK